MNRFWQFGIVSLLAAATVSCSSTTAQCGGRVFPDGVDAEALEIAEKAVVASKSFCAESDAGCDFTVAKTSQGWSVAVTRMYAVDGKCASRIGDEKFYAYDASGTLISVIDGM